MNSSVETKRWQLELTVKQLEYLLTNFSDVSTSSGESTVGKRQQLLTETENGKSRIPVKSIAQVLNSGDIYGDSKNPCGLEKSPLSSS